MLILGDEGHYHGRFPWVTIGLVGMNLLVFVAQCIMGEELTNGFSLVPAEIAQFKDMTGTYYLKVKEEVVKHDEKTGKVHIEMEEKKVPIQHYPGPVPIVLTLFTSMFMHGDIFHLIGNMWFLVVFGRNIECAFDHARFLVFYLVCGIIGGLAHTASDMSSIIPCLGASGAIAGVLGAYLIMHPLNKIKIWFGLYIGVVQVPAFVVIGGWFLLQYVLGMLSLSYEEFRSGVAYWDHIGGFLSGVTIVGSLIFILKWRVSSAEPEEATATEAIPSPADSAAAGDGQPAVAVPVADPVAQFIAMRRSTFEKQFEARTDAGGDNRNQHDVQTSISSNHP